MIRPNSAELERIELTADPGRATHLAALRSGLDARLVDFLRLEGERGVDAWADGEFLCSGAEVNITVTNALRAYAMSAPGHLHVS